MKKFTKIIALVLAVVMMFSGCATMNIKSTIKSDGTVVSDVVMELDKAEYDAMCMKNNPDMYKSPADVENALKETYAGTDGELGTETKVEVITKDDGKQYYIVSQGTTEKLNEESRYTNLAGMYGFEDYYMTKDAVYITYDGQAMVEMMDLMAAMDPTTNYDLSNVKFNFTVEFPADIVSSQGGTVDTTNPKVITFNLPVNGGKITAFATTNSSVTVATVKADIKKLTTVKKTKIKSVKVKSVKKKKGTVSLKLAKVKGAKYEVQYSTNKKFKKATKTKSSKKTSFTIKKLKAGKKYYFRARAYKEDELGNVYYSKYSKKKSLKIVKKSKKK